MFNSQGAPTSEICTQVHIFVLPVNTRVMLGNISFIGGIHGVGKSTVCADICAQTKLEYLSASKLIKWKEINTDAFNKKVVDIPSTQDRLINGLNQATQAGIHYLLDGHYCLLDRNGVITPVPVDTFIAMKPTSLHIIIGDVLEIKRRLQERDAKMYDKDLLHKMQEKEMQHANEVASLLGVTLSIDTQAEYSMNIASIKKLHAL